jgi:hypothetical protein
MHGLSAIARLETRLPEELAFLKDCPKSVIRQVYRVVRDAHKNLYSVRNGYANEREAWDDSQHKEMFEELEHYISQQRQNRRV